MYPATECISRFEKNRSEKDQTSSLAMQKSPFSLPLSWTLVFDAATNHTDARMVVNLIKFSMVVLRAEIVYQIPQTGNFSDVPNFYFSFIASTSSL